jgi:hypothetical protein
MVLSYMLNAHAMAFAKRGVYGGACDRTPPNRPDWRRQQKQLIVDLGLQNILKFDCPPTNDTINKHAWIHGGIPKDSWSPQYRAHLHEQVDWKKVMAEAGGSDGGVFRIAVHIRRGDVTPCNKWKHRYLPNAHYLRVLDEHAPADRPHRVYIFSETKSSEKWGAFRSRNYTLMLDASIATTWAHIMTADVVVLGWSSFSLFPATFNTNGRIIYTPYNFSPLRGWTSLNRTYLDLVKRDMEQFRCGKK